jgi:hypothetical protein
MIIVYRNRMPKHIRENILSINKKRFIPIRDLVAVKFSFLKNKEILKRIKYSVVSLIVISLGLFSYMNIS